MKRWWVVVLVVALLAVGVWQVQARQGRAEEAQQWQTAKVTRGTLQASVSASGMVRAHQGAVLSWQTTGIVGHVNVALGDEVTQDQVLADLREDSWPQAILQARVSLLNAQKQLQDLRDAADLKYAQALQALATAERQLDRAQNHYDTLVDWDEDEAQEEYEKWRNMVISLQRSLNNPKTPPQMKPAIRTQLEIARERERIAKANLDGPSDLDLQEARAAVALAQAQVNQAKRDIQRWKDGPPQDQVAILEAQIAAAQATLDLTRLKAPFDGVVTDVRLSPGDMVAPGTLAFRVDDLSNLYVDVDLSELDVATVAVGQEVTLTFDALAGKTFHGVVDEVALAGTQARPGGAVNFRVTVRLTDKSSAIRPGMTAAVTIHTTRVDDALLVPARAVRVRDGRSVVFLLQNGEPTPVEVTLGATSGEFVQIVSGDVKEGDLVVLNPPAESFNFFGGQ